MSETGKPTVFIVDDDISVREGLGSLIRSVGLRVEAFGSAEDFQQYQRPDAPNCLILDVRLPGVSGLLLQKQLFQGNDHIPIIFLTAHGDTSMAVSSMKAGAFEFFTKPPNEQDLLDALHLALDRSARIRAREKELDELRGRFQSLTSREQQILRLIASGHTNRRIAKEAGLSESTIRVNRARIMRKMLAAYREDLARFAIRLGISV